MKHIRLRRAAPTLLAIATASSLSALTFQPLSEIGQSPRLQEQVSVELVGQDAEALNIFEDNLDVLLGVPVYGAGNSFAGHVDELMFGAAGNVDGFVLAVPSGIGIKRVAADAAAFKVAQMANNGIVLLADVDRAALQDKRQFEPAYATDF